MKRVDGKLRLSVFALAIAGAFAATPAMSQEPAADAGAAVDAGGGGGDFSGGGDSGGDGGFFSNLGFAFSGFVRIDGTFRTDPDENPNNLRTNSFNDVPQPRAAGGPPYTIPTPAGTPVLTSTDTRNTRPGHNDWSVQQLRGKFDLGVTLSSNVQMYASLRTIYDLGNYDNWDPDDVPGSTPDGFSQQEPNFFEYDDYRKGGCLYITEVCGKHYMADFTALYFDVTAGPALIRVGQQQIAWGQALFFRVFDVPNGLDLRRHLILDDALEEYADERVAAPGIRVTWQVTDQWEADAYAQMFQPTVYPTANSPYNVIPAQFSVHELYNEENRYQERPNYGLRIRGNFGNWGLQAIATQRWNHEGVFRWTESGTNTDIPGVPGSGMIVQFTPLEVDPSGVHSANEWFTYAGQVRLDGVEGLNTLINEFNDTNRLTTGLAGVDLGPLLALLGTDPGLGPTGSLGALPVPAGDTASASRELDLFFTLTGGLRGHIAHEYFQEEVYGVGASYVVEAEPGSLLDQLIINVETSYIPERYFTEKSLSRNYIKSDESVSDLVMEKYHRWFDEFPATYMVFQAIHKSDSNLFGQHLGCQGGTGGSPGTVAAQDNPKVKQCTNEKKGGSTNVVLAFLQPFPNYIYRLTGAALLDVDGGLLVQGGFRWSPGNDLTFDFIYNYIDGNMYGDPNSNALQNIDWADEFTIRAAYQF